VSAFPSAGKGPDRDWPRSRCGSAVTSAHRGFTLIEVLAALVIVALGMIAAIQAVTQSARNGVYLRDKTLAHWIGMNVLTERRLQASPPDVAESTGRVEFAGEQWQWSMQVTQTQVESLRRMDISVRRADAPEESSLAIVSGFYGTAVGGAGGGGMPTQWAGGGGSGTPPDEAAGQNSGEDGDGFIDRTQPTPDVPTDAPPEVVPDE
jgi:general secretion pathway protein I